MSLLLLRDRLYQLASLVLASPNPKLHERKSSNEKVSGCVKAIAKDVCFSLLCMCAVAQARCNVSCSPG